MRVRFLHARLYHSHNMIYTFKLVAGNADVFSLRAQSPNCRNDEEMRSEAKVGVWVDGIDCIVVDGLQRSFSCASARLPRGSSGRMLSFCC